MRIAIVTETFEPQINGVVTILQQLLAYAHQRSHELLIVGPHSSTPQHPHASVAQLRGLRFPLYDGLSITPPQSALFKHLQAFQPDVIHTFGTLLLGHASARAGQRLGVPVISSYHSHFAAYTSHYRLGALQALTWWWLRRAHNATQLTLCPSTTTRRELTAQHFRNVEVWPGGVDIERFSPAHRDLAWRRAHGIADDTPLVLTVSRLAAEKNLHLLAQALKQVHSPYQAVIVGDGPARTQLAAQFDPQTIFTGYLRGHDLARAYASADLFVFPSASETFGQVTLEALAAGVPAIATATGGALDLIQHGQNGLLVAPNDASALATALQQLLSSSPAERRAMAQAAHRTAQSFSWSNVMSQLFNTYAQVISAAQPQLAALAL